MNEDGKIIVGCPVCKIPVAPHSAAELIEWFPRHCVVSPQCAQGDIREMIEKFEHGLKEVEGMKNKMMSKMFGDNK